MIIRPLTRSIATILYGPDTEIAPAAGAAPAETSVAIPAGASPTGADIHRAPPREQKAAQVIQPAPEKTPVKQKGIVDVKKAFGLEKSPSKMNSEEGKKIAERSKQSTVIPVPKIRSKGEAKAPETDPGTVEPTQKLQEVEPAAPAAAAEVPKFKIKLGDKEEELTQDEIQSRMAEMQAKLTPAPESKLPATEKTATSAKTPEQIAADAAEEQRKDSEFLTGLAKEYAPDDKTMDTILAGGPKAIEAFSAFLAKSEYNARKFAADAINKLYSDIDPVLAHFSQIDQYQDEMAFGNEHPDVKPFIQTARDIKQTLMAKYPEQFAAMTPSDRRAEIAIHTRNFIKRYNIAAPTPAAAAPQAVAAAAPVAQPVAAPIKAAPPKPKPPTGNVGNGSAPAAVNKQASMVQNLIAHGH